MVHSNTNCFEVTLLHLFRSFYLTEPEHGNEAEVFGVWPEKHIPSNVVILLCHLK